MILVWGTPDDPPTGAVIEALGRAGLPHALVDHREPPSGTRFMFGEQIGGTIGDLDLADVRAAFIRPNSDDDRSDAMARFNHCLSAWTELAPITVVNRLSAQASNTSKLYQGAVIRAHGFTVPPSLATTDPAAARDFVDRHGTVIYKSLSGVRSIVRRLQPDERDRLDEVRACPTLFQQYIEGVDHRVHVVGREVFTTSLVSERDDYRYDDRTERTAVRLPDDVAARCRALSNALRLDVSGIDLRLTPAGDWVCFEVNPSPAFPYFEQADEIADAIAALLRDSGGSDQQLAVQQGDVGIRLPTPRPPTVGDGLQVLV